MDFSIDLSELEELDNRTQELCQYEIQAGVINGDEKYPDSKLTVYDVACINEYGSADGLRPPERAFISSTVEREENNFQEMMTNAYFQLVDSGRANLEQIGKAAAGAITKTIDSNLHPHPHNAPKTIKRKHFDHPLIETGRLKSNIDFIITKKGE